MNAIRAPVGRQPRLGGVAGPRRRPHALQRAGAHVAHDDVGARLRALGVLVGLEGDEAAVARDRRVVRRPRGRAGRVARGPDPARAQVADVHAHLPVALGEVQVAVARTRTPPSARPRTSPGCSWSSAALGAAREQRRRPPRDAGHHRDLAARLGDRQLGLVALEGQAPAVTGDRGVVGVVGRGRRRLARAHERRRAVVARLLQPARQLPQLAGEQALGLRGRDRLMRDAPGGGPAQPPFRRPLRVAAREAVEPADLQRAHLAAPQARPLDAARDAEDRGGMAGQRLLVQGVEEEMLGEVALRERAQSALLELGEPLRVDLVRATARRAPRASASGSHPRCRARSASGRVSSRSQCQMTPRSTPSSR